MANKAFMWDGDSWEPIGSQITTSSTFEAATASDTPLTLKGATGQTADILKIENADSTPSLIVDANQRVFVGHSGWEGEWYSSSSAANRLFVVGSGTSRGAIFAVNYGDSGEITLARSNGASVGERGVILSGETVGSIVFAGDNPANPGYNSAAMIRAQADGEWSTASDTSDSPGKLIFSTTPDGAGIPTSRMEIDSTGTVAMYGDLTVDGDINMASVTGDKVTLYGTKDTSSNYSIGVESSAMYYKSNGSHRWYSQVNADGGTSAEMILSSSGLLSGTGASLGAWTTTYVPSIGGTNWSLGSTGSAAIGAYVQIGKTVHFRAKLKFGTAGATFGAGIPTVSLPMAALSSEALNQASSSFSAIVFDSSTSGAFKVHPWSFGLTSAVYLYATNTTSDALTAVTSTVPIPWAAGDEIYISGTYEVA